MATVPVINQQLDTLNGKLDKQNALLEIMAASSLESLKSDWEGLSLLADSGLFGDAYEIGTQFADTWTDVANNNTEYTYPMQLNHVGDVELEDGETLSNRPFLQAHYAHPFGVQFSHQRAFLMVAFKVASALTSGSTYYFERALDSKTISFKAPAAVSVGEWITLNNGNIEIYDTNGNLKYTTPATIGTGTTGTSLGASPTLAAGNYYFTHSTSTVVSFTTTEQLEMGDRLGYWSSKVYPVTSDGKTVGTGLTTGTSTSGTDLGTLAANTRTTPGTYFLNGSNEMQYGWNRWKTSAIRQYLNSDGDVGAWWTAQDGFDIRPDEHLTKKGFLSGWDASIVAALKPVKVTTYPNTVQDDTGGNTPDVTIDRVFLPSLEQIYATPQKSGEGEYHEYWKRKVGLTSPMSQGGTYPNAITYAVEAHTTAVRVRLRSASRGSSSNTWIVNSSGGVSYYGAYYSSRFSPLVVL